MPFRRLLNQAKTELVSIPKYLAIIIVRLKVCVKIMVLYSYKYFLFSIIGQVQDSRSQNLQCSIAPKQGKNLLLTQLSAKKPHRNQELIGMAVWFGLIGQKDASRRMIRLLLLTQHIGILTLLVLDMTPLFRYAEKAVIITFDIASKYSKYISLVWFEMCIFIAVGV